jgi:hypothetical protein
MQRRSSTDQRRKRKRLQPIHLVLRITILDRHVLALDVAGFLQALEKRDSEVIIRGLITEEPDHRQHQLPRPRHHWRHHGAPEPRDELPAFH